MTDILLLVFFFFFNDTATTEIYTLSLHDALPIYPHRHHLRLHLRGAGAGPQAGGPGDDAGPARRGGGVRQAQDRKSTRLNSSHANISYAVFCLKKKKTT